MVVISELDEMRSVHSFPKLVGNWGKGVYKVLYKQVMLVVVVCQTTVCTDRQSGCHCQQLPRLQVFCCEFLSELPLEYFCSLILSLLFQNSFTMAEGHWLVCNLRHSLGLTLKVK